jgi:hypothetical protein
VVFRLANAVTRVLRIQRQPTAVFAIEGGCAPGCFAASHFNLNARHPRRMKGRAAAATSKLR